MLEAKLVRSFRTRLILIGLLSCGIGSLVLYLISRGYVRTLDDQTVTTRGGKVFSWSDLKTVSPVYVQRHGNRRLNHVDLIFSNGKAGVFYQMFENGAEVLHFVRTKTGQNFSLKG